MRGWIVRIAIIALIAVGAFILRDRISGQAADLKVGDCFDEPQGLAANAEVKDVQHHPCTEAHTAEVLFVGDHPGANDAYPTEDQFDSYIVGQCLAAFKAYTGKDYETDEVLDIGSLLPTAEGWKSSDHAVTCYVVRVDKGSMTTSVKVAP